MSVQDITATSLHNWLEDKDKAIKPVVLDVREHFEHNLAHINIAKLVPMKEIPFEIKYMDKNLTYVCFCHHGIKSKKVAVFLRDNGFNEVFNLVGGIESWSNLIDNDVAKY